MELQTFIQYEDRDGNGKWIETITTYIMGNQIQKERLKKAHRAEVEQIIKRLENEGNKHPHVVVKHECPHCGGAGFIYKRK